MKSIALHKREEDSDISRSRWVIAVRGNQRISSGPGPTARARILRMSFVGRRKGGGDEEVLSPAKVDKEIGFSPGVNYVATVRF